MTDRRLSCKKAFLTRLWGKVTERWVFGTLGSMTSVEWTGVIRTLTCLCCSGCFCCGIEGNHTEQQLVKPAVRRRKKRLVWSCSATGPLTECQWTHRRRWRTRRHDDTTALDTQLQFTVTHFPLTPCFFFHFAAEIWVICWEPSVAPEFWLSRS